VKRCPRCGETKPHSGFFKNKRRSDGLQGYCKECSQAAIRAVAADTPEKARERAVRKAERKALERQGMKRCPACDEVKPFDEFNRDKTNRDGLCPHCKECKYVTWRARYEAKNPDSVKKTAARRALAEQGMSSCADCNEVKPVDEFYKDERKLNGLQPYCRSCQYARSKAFQKKNPEWTQAYWRKATHIRRARKAGIPQFEIIPKDQRRLDLGVCAHAHLGGCNGVITEDHVIPVSKPGSSHGIGNLQAMCKAHNSSKHDKWEVEARYAPQLKALRAQRDDLVEAVLLAREILRVIDEAQQVHA
jgi:hypothetical protein